MTDLIALNPSDIQTANGEPCIYDLRLAEALGFEQQRDIRKLIQRHESALRQLGEFRATVAQNTSGRRGRPSSGYLLNKKQALYICTKSETARATEATIAMVEVFEAVASGKPLPAKTIPVRAHVRKVKSYISEIVDVDMGGGLVYRVDLSNSDPEWGCLFVGKHKGRLGLFVRNPLHPNRFITALAHLDMPCDVAIMGRADLLEKQPIETPKKRKA